MSDILSITLSGRLTKDPELKYHNDKAICTISLACTDGFGDKAKTLFFNCTCWGARGESLNKHNKKGDQIFITGRPTQNKHDDKVYHGVTIDDWVFGQRAGSKSDSKSSDDAPPYDDDDIPY